MKAEKRERLKARRAAIKALVQDRPGFLSIRQAKAAARQKCQGNGYKDAMW